MAKKIKGPKGGILNHFEKGESGNPKGRPKGIKDRSTIARQVLGMVGILPDQIFNKLKQMYPAIDKRMTVEEIMTITLANKAISKGDHNAYNALMDSGHGKAPQAHEVTGADGGPIEILTNASDDQIKAACEAALASKKLNSESENESE